MRISDWSSDVCSSDLEDQRKVLRDAFLDRRLLHAEADIRQPELSGIGKCRILRDQIHPRRIARLAVEGDRIGQVPRLCARLAVAIRVADRAEHLPLTPSGRSEERRDGNRWVRKCEAW